MKKAVSLCALLVSGCVEKESFFDFPYDTQTEEGIKVETNDYAPDFDLVDAKYRAVGECLGLSENTLATRIDTFYITIANDDSSFDCIIYEQNEEGTWVGTPGMCAGQYDFEEREIKVVESLSALAHEFRHMLALDPYHNEESIRCGDRIDSEFAGEELRVIHNCAYR